MGEKQKTKKKERRVNDGNNNGQATHGPRKHAWRTQATWANFLWEKYTFIDILKFMKHIKPAVSDTVDGKLSCLLHIP